MKKFITVILSVMVIWTLSACTANAPTIDTTSQPEISPRREPAHVATFMIQESEIWFTPSETIFELFELTPEDVEAEKTYCEANDIAFSMSLDIRMFTGNTSASLHIPLTQLNICPEAIVWKRLPASDMTAEVISMEVRKDVYTYTATLKIGTKTHNFIETYESKDTTNCRYSGDYTFQDLRPKLA